MKALTRKNILIALSLIFICMLCICDQMIINYSAPNAMMKKQRSRQEYTEFTVMDNMSLSRNTAHFLQDGELITEEVFKQQLLKIEDFNMTMWNHIIVVGELIKQFLLRSKILLFTYLICNLLRFLITYRYKQDGKKQFLSVELHHIQNNYALT